MSDPSGTPAPRMSPAGPVPLPLRIVDRMSDACAVVAAAGVVLLATNIALDVLGRMLLNAPVPGTIERTTYWWMPTLALLAFAFTEKRQEHIKVTILLDALPPRMRQIVEGVFGLLATALLFALVYHAWHDAVRSHGFREVTASSPPVSVWPFRFVAVAGIAMIALQSAATTVRQFAGLPPGGRDEDPGADFA